MAQIDQATPRVTSWELVCCTLYIRGEKKEILGYPPLTKRSIDEVFLFRAIMGRLFRHIDDYDDLRSKLHSGGFSTNLVELKTLPRTEAGIQEAYRRARVAFKHKNYNDENEVDQDKSNYRSKKKINVPFFDLLQISTNSIAMPFAPEIRRRKDIPLYYSSGDLPQVVPPEWDSAPTDVLDHVAVDNTGDNCESESWLPETSVEKISWERICRDLYNAKKRKAMLGYPPLTKRSIDEVFLFRALTGRIFESSRDSDDLWKRLLLSGIIVNLSALKTLPRTEGGIQEAYRRAKQAFQHDNYDDENEVDADESNNHSYKTIHVTFMEVVKIVDDSIVERFVPEARLRQHSTVYCSTGELAEVDSSKYDDVPIDNPPQSHVDKTVTDSSELEQSKTEDWEDLQRRLRATGNSDDLTCLQNFEAAKFDIQASSMETTTGRTTASTGTGVTTIGQKRNVMDCHENDNHQDNPNNHVDDDETMRKKDKVNFSRLSKEEEGRSV